MVASNDYALDSVLSHSKGLIFLVTLNEENYLTHFIYDNNNHTESRQIYKKFNPSHEQLDYNRILFCHLLFDLETKRYEYLIYLFYPFSLLYLFSTDKKIFHQNITINKPNVIFDLSSFDNYTINGLYTFKNGLSSFIFVLLNENILIELNTKKEQGNQAKLLNTLLKQRKGLITPSNRINIIDCQYLKEGHLIINHTVCLFDRNESNVISLWRFSNEERIRNVVVYYTDSLKLIALELEGGLLRVIDYALFKIICEFKANYGHLTAISFSFDGNLLGIGTEDDNGYIIDIQSKQIVSCLEGHKNYITEFLIELKSKNMSNSNTLPANNSLLNNHSHNHNQSQPHHLNLENVIFREVDKIVLLNEWKISPSSLNNEHKIHSSQINKRKKTTSLSYLRIVGEIQNYHLEQQKKYDIYTCGLDGNICSWEIEYKAIKRNHYDEDDQSSVPTARNIESLIEDDMNPLKKKMFQYYPPIKLEFYSKAPILSESVGKYPIITFDKIDSVMYVVQKEKSDCSAKQIGIFCRNIEIKPKEIQNEKLKPKQKTNNKPARPSSAGNLKSVINK